jgi:hypothetical protein
MHELYIDELQMMDIIDYSLFHVALKNFSLIWRRHHYR